ncbi:MAG: MarR family transcriptional regulator [Treponema sp.]|jgi:DNA-binding MarR family transcriptional regulator|nr:MarR family transcriptional regulator [Treponema sp.]
MPINSITDSEYIILENIYAQDRRNLSLKQRDLAQLARTSLGMTNSIVKRLIQKGWITAKKMNARNIRYVVTLEGINEIIHRSYGFFKRTIKNIAYYKDTIDDIIHNVAEREIKAVLLLGTSDLEFIIEHICNYYGLSFLKSADRNILSGGIDDFTMVFFAEDVQYSAGEETENRIFISRLFLNIEAAS